MCRPSSSRKLFCPGFCLFLTFIPCISRFYLLSNIIRILFFSVYISLADCRKVEAIALKSICYLIDPLPPMRMPPNMAKRKTKKTTLHQLQNVSCNKCSVIFLVFLFRHVHTKWPQHYQWCIFSTSTCRSELWLLICCPVCQTIHRVAPATSV